LQEYLQPRCSTSGFFVLGAFAFHNYPAYFQSIILKFILILTTMINQVYKIDNSQLDKLRNRLLLKNAKFMAGVFLLVIVLRYPQGMGTKISFITFTICIIPIILLAIYISTNKLKKAYSTLEIVLTQDGVESKAEMMPYRRIIWPNLEIEEKSNGVIYLYDKTISKFMRKMYGKGCIIIQLEMLNKEDLLSQLYKYKQ
jgi:hypothetical protein